MNKLKISLSGFGFIGRYHTIAYRAMPLCYDNFPCDIELYKLLTSKNKTPGETGYNEHVGNMKDLYDTDILDICTPNFMHGNQIREAANLGIKHIYCEKPLYGQSCEEDELSKIVRDKGITNQIAFMMRFLPAVVRAKRILEDGLIGEVINFSCRMDHQSYINPDRPMSWRLEKDKSFGGALVDLGVHMIDLVHFLLGNVMEVRGYTNTVYKTRPSKDGVSNVTVDDFAHLDLTLGSGSWGTLEVSKVAAGKDEHTFIEIYGTKGSIRVDVTKPDWPDVYLVKTNTWQQGGFKFDDAEEDLRTIWPSYKFNLGWMMNAHMASLYSFILYTMGKKLGYISLPSFEDSLKACKVLEAAYRSSERGGLTELV